MNTYYLRELRKAAFHIFKIRKRMVGYYLVDTRFPDCPMPTVKTLEEAKKILKAFRDEYIMGRCCELINEYRLKKL